MLELYGLIGSEENKTGLYFYSLGANISKISIIHIDQVILKATI